MSSRCYLYTLLCTILKSASCVIRMGEFRVLRGLSLCRLVRSESGVMKVGDFMLLRHFRVSRLPMDAPPASHVAFVCHGSEVPKKIQPTRRVWQPSLAPLFSMFSRNYNLNPAFNDGPR
jgi:hypothetical protein